MRIKPNKLKIWLIHIINPIFLVVAGILYLITRNSSLSYFIILFSVIINVFVLISTYNLIELSPKKIVVIKGFFFKQSISVNLKDILDLERTGIALSEFKPLYGLVLTLRKTQTQNKDNLIVYRGYLSSEEFEKFEQQLIKQVNENGKKHSK